MNRNELVLHENLLRRFEYNERTKLYSIKGNITSEEYAALLEAQKAFRNHLYVLGERMK